MKNKPDMIVMLFLVFTLGAAISNATVGGADPHEVTHAIHVR